MPTKKKPNQTNKKQKAKKNLKTHNYYELQMRMTPYIVIHFINNEVMIIQSCMLYIQ